MNKRSVVLLILNLFMISGILTAQSLTPDEMLKKMEENLYPVNYFSRIVMKTVKPGKKDSSLSMDIYYRKDAGTYMELTSPSRSRGTRFLQKEGALWMFSTRSKSSRSIRLSANESFQGSVFSNNDLSDPEYTDDYKSVLKGKVILEDPDLGSVECYILQADALGPESPYSRLVCYVTVQDYIPLKMEYYAKSGKLFKRMILSQVKKAAGKMRPMYLRMESLEEVGAYTEVLTEELDERNDLSNRMFTTDYLTR